MRRLRIPFDTLYASAIIFKSPAFIQYSVSLPSGQSLGSYKGPHERAAHLSQLFCSPEGIYGCAALHCDA